MVLSIILPSLYFTKCRHLTLQSGLLTVSFHEPWIKTQASEILTWNILYFLSTESDQLFDYHIPYNVQVQSLCVRKCLAVHAFYHLLDLVAYVYITNFENCHSFVLSLLLSTNWGSVQTWILFYFTLLRYMSWSYTQIIKLHKKIFM
jgi:hypothetical protein